MGHSWHSDRQHISDEDLAIVRSPLTATEKETLHASLNTQRDVIVWKLQGLDDDALRKPMTPTGTNLLGMMKHLAAVEYGWFCTTFGRETEPLPFDENDDSSRSGRDH
jgi:uncharacterized damage-inducible protein DinB